MIKPTRKQREIEQRESLILDVAREMLLEHGYLGLRMEQIADRIEYSKGTIYQHFPNKEEIILALANRAQLKRSELFAEAVTTRRKSRERIVAVGAAAELFVERFPHFFQVGQIIRINSIWEKTSEKRQQVMRTCESRSMAIMVGVVRDALAHGDLELNDELKPEDLVFGLWSIHLGATAILSSSDSLHEIGIRDPAFTVRSSMHRMLDGYGWRPLSTEVDYNATFDECKRELAECRAFFEYPSRTV